MARASLAQGQRVHHVMELASATGVLELEKNDELGLESKTWEFSVGVKSDLLYQVTSFL